MAIASEIQTLRAAVYARVSQDRVGRTGQTRDSALGRVGRSVAEQEAESVAACEANGWTVVEVYRDNDVSASRFGTKARPDWARLVDDLTQGRFDVLVLWEPSRGSRELTPWTMLLDACREQGVLVHITSHSQTYDVSRPRDWRSLAEDGVDSAYESEKSSQRIIRAMHANAVAGRPHGRIPYGYTRLYDPHTKELVGQQKDPETSPIVIEIIERLARAEAVSRVTDDLNNRGVPSPSGKQWSRQVVRRVALNPSYAGLRVHGGETYDGDWPALVDASTHYAVKRLLEDPRRRVGRPGRAKYLLSYIARCSVCGEGLSGAPRGYFCPGNHVGAQIDWMDRIVEQAILTRLQDPRLLDRVRESDDQSVVQARERVAILRLRLNEFRDAAVAGTVSVASLAHAEAALTEQIAEAMMEAEQVGAPAALRDLLDADLIEAQWDRMPMASRREIVTMLADVVLGRSTAPRGAHTRDDYDRVRIEWKALPE